MYPRNPTGHLNFLDTTPSLPFLFLFITILVASQIPFGCTRQVHSSNFTCIESERQALLRLRDSLTDESNRLSSWIGEDCCSWDGISCHKTTGYVVTLDLRNTYLSPSLVNLTNLRYLDLSLNNFSGIRIPTYLGLLKDLRYLNLSDAGFVGEVPHHLGNLSHLRYLDIDLEGCRLVVPHLLYVNFTSLSSLKLSFNQFLNPTLPPWLRNLTGLQDLGLGANNLDDKVHDTFRQMTSLVNLDLGGNHFDTSTLRSICNISSLTSLDMSDNELQGSIPSEIGQFPQLTVLKLSNNRLNDTIPYSLWQLTKLQALYIGANALTGVLSEHHFAKLKELKRLDISLNLLSLHVSSSWVPPFQLQYIGMGSNHLSGRIHLCLGNLRNLRILHLGSNSLYGQIPGSLGNLGELIILQLSKNRFDGKLPPSMQNLKRLQSLDLGENRIADTIPPWIGERLSDLEFLTLQSNNFHGGISNTLCQLPYLQVLNLAHNDLSGSIPHCFKNFTAMESTEPGTFQYSNYTYHDPILHNFKAGIELEYSKNMESVKSISLSGNNLVGEIPDEIMGLVGLQTLNLSKNHLNGRIPKNIGNLKQLETLDLSMNELRGEIPPSLSSIYSLSFLNLSYNKLSGPIPSGNQLQTLNDPSTYEGNIGLCGKPLLNSCPAGESPTENGPVLDDKGHTESDFSWFYAGFGPGFSVGAVGVVGILQFKQSWRYALFK
ncbi:unnamed protein product [Coffea canephora]|uniref:DH200=94 genomic scaffold, scaffold_1542 n=1 Tax=Coffea canephora TaxID=49390 RepID=A0A068VM05_COFCA|nr:unnamed protein product [Coffea canephora]